jgi:hypothetical protein
MAISHCQCRRNANAVLEASRNNDGPRRGDRMRARKDLPGNFYRRHCGRAAHVLLAVVLARGRTLAAEEMKGGDTR